MGWSIDEKLFLVESRARPSQASSSGENSPVNQKSAAMIMNRIRLFIWYMCIKYKAIMNHPYSKNVLTMLNPYMIHTVSML